MAHTTGLDTEADMASWRIDQRFFGHFQLAFAHRLNGPVCRGAFHDLTPLSSPRVRSGLPTRRSRCFVERETGEDIPSPPGDLVPKED
jgi:hypothetical protein